MRTCSMCGELKSNENFRKYKHFVNNKEYISTDSYCKNCRKLYDKEQHRIQRARKKEVNNYGNS